MTEIEIKLTLKKEGYETLLSKYALNITGVLRQNNIFFDTNDKKLKRSMRLRCIKTAEIPTRWVVTTKGPGTIVDGISSRSEIEEAVSDEIAQNILNDTKNLYRYVPKCVRKAVKKTKESEYFITGNFVSIRRVIPIDGYVIEADECIYPNGEKLYEIEVESNHPENDKIKIVKLLTDLGISFEESKITKHKRLKGIPAEQRINLDL